MVANLQSLTFNQVLHCDCLDGMKQLPDGCVPLTVTSPPYDNLRDYGGHPFAFEPIADELLRITAEGGVVVWIVQDQVKDGRESGSSLRQRLYFETIGFVPYATLIMRSSGFRFPHKTRYPQQFQYAFVFAKGKPRIVNLLQDRPNSTAGGKVKNSVRNKDGKTVTAKHPSKRIRRFGLRGNIWTYEAGFGKTTKDKIAFEHPALMQEAMAEDFIISFSRPGDLVFDPMCGSGTTCKMALLNDRRYMGMEIHTPYWEIAAKRLDSARKQHRQKLDDFLLGRSSVCLVSQSEHGPVSKKSFVPYTAKTTIQQGNVVDVLRTLDDNSFHGILTDPPYGLTSIMKRYGGKNAKPQKTDVGAEGTFGRHASGFMGQLWDNKVPTAEVWAELLRVSKPGTWLLSFGHPRTFHRLMSGIEAGGWEIRDTLMWLYGQGFPKSLDLGKAMTDNAWNGYGTALKPAYEPIVLAMKPCDGSFARNAAEWDVAGLNINGCRIGIGGRFPANVILDEEAAGLLDEQSPVSIGGQYRKSGKRDHRHKGRQLYRGGIGGGEQNAPDTYGDAGGASRFFFCPKVSKRERNAGLSGFPVDRPDCRSERAMGMYAKQGGIRPQENDHCCVKPLSLCRYLSMLILPPHLQSARRLLVPYCGTGSEVIGAMQAGWDEITGIELSPEYIAKAHARIDWWRNHESFAESRP